MAYIDRSKNFEFCGIASILWCHTGSPRFYQSDIWGGPFTWIDLGDYQSGNASSNVLVNIFSAYIPWPLPRPLQFAGFPVIVLFWHRVLSILLEQIDQSG